APQQTPDADFVDAPANTTILGAAKVTGKLGRWSVGVLDALTDREHALTAAGPLTARQTVEPMTNYFVTRETRELGSSSRIGIMLTSVDRKLPQELTGMRERAQTAGIDGYTDFPNKDWIFEWYAAGSHVAGSAQAMASTQQSASRYYQRPDATSFHFDPART